MKILEFFSSEIGSMVLSLIVTVVVTLTIIICKLIASRTKNEKLKRLAEILPDIMLEVENSGLHGVGKLETCIKRVKETIKGLRNADIERYIESFIKVSHTINIQTQEKVNSSNSISTRS